MDWRCLDAHALNAVRLGGVRGLLLKCYREKAGEALELV
jgi:hypothetical protein